MKTTITLSLAFSLLFGSLAGAATIATYLDRSALDAAMDTSTLIDFSAGLVTSPATNYSTAAGLTLDGVNFTGPGPSSAYAVTVQAPTDSLRSGWDGNNVVLNGASSAGYSILAALPVGTTGVGFDLYTVAHHEGAKHGFIAKVLDLHANTITNHLKEYSKGGLAGTLEDRYYRPSSSLEPFLERLKCSFRAAPVADAKQAVARIESLAGIRPSESQARRFMKGLGMKIRKACPIPDRAGGGFFGVAEFSGTPEGKRPRFPKLTIWRVDLAPTR